jgi:nitronate monooxygenase
MRLRTPLTDLLEIDHPILLAPMAGVSGGALASAVTGAGGLGLIGGGYGDAGWLGREIAAAGNARVGIGFITWSLARQPDVLDVALAHAPPAIMLSFGDFSGFLPKIRQTRARLIVQVQTLEQAREAVDANADVIVAQGTEAGGHGARRATFPLVPAIVDIAGDIPVVAAGGIADGRGLAAALMLGASGVLCGTAFYAADEALTPESAKDAAVEGRGDATIRSSVFDVARALDWPTAWDLRTLQNDFTRRWHSDPAGLATVIADERARFEKARAAGDVTTAPVIVGEAVDLVRTREPAGAIVTRVVDEAVERLRGASHLLD